MNLNSIRNAAVTAALLTAISVMAAPEHVYQLPYEPEGGHSFSDAGWGDKVVIHPEAFPEFDFTNKDYVLDIKTEKSVQIGRAKWSNDTESEFTRIQENSASGEFTLTIDRALGNHIKNESYCLQFNSAPGNMLYYVRLTEKDGGDGKTDEPDEPVGPIDFTKGLHTEGTMILDGNGNEFVMRGMNLAWTDFSWSISSAADWGCNAVRLNIGRGTGWENNFVGNTSVDGLENHIKKCEEKKMIAVPCPQDHTCGDEDWIVSGAVDFWLKEGMVDMMNRHAGSTILNITNEWYKGGDEYDGWNGSTTPRTQQEINDAAKYWSGEYVKAIKRLRGAGVRNLILIDVAGCGQGAPVLNAKYIDGNGQERFYAQDIIDADAAFGNGKSNVAFSIHMYQISGRDGTTIRRNIDYCLNLDVPCVLGEFAFEHKPQQGWSRGGKVAWRDIQEYSREKNVSWLAWSWSGNGGGAESCDMFDGSGNLKENGNVMFNGPQGIKRTSTCATIYTNTTETGMAYQYPVQLDFGDIHWGNGGRGGNGDDAEDDGTEYEDPVNIDSNYIDETSGDGWGHYYIVKPEAFKELGEKDKLRIKIGDSGQTAVYVNSVTDHNGAGNTALHLIGDAHYDGANVYNYSDVGSGVDRNVSVSKYPGLKTYGIKAECNGCSLQALQWLKAKPADPDIDQPTEPKEYDLAANCKRNISEKSAYFVPPTAFDNFAENYNLEIRCQPAAAGIAGRRLAAGDPVMTLYTSDNNGYTKNTFKEITEDPFSIGEPYVVRNISADEIKTLKSNGLYVAGSNYRLESVKAVKRVSTGIPDIDTTPAAGPDAIYTLQGVRVNEMQPGNIYILVRNGKATKVMK